jgi:D-alanyl-D-alanine carboxypeptidase
MPVPPQESIDQFIAEQMEQQHIPGLSLAVVREGSLVLARGYGQANLELAVPATRESVYEIGSITKQFTAVAVVMLVEEGKIGLDASITRYLEGLPPAWEAVTVRHLLNHTSGIKSYTSLPDFMRLTIHPTTREEIVALVADLPFDFAPGSRYSYCNTGYFLLGSIIEAAGGKPYAEFLDERIFLPLEMTATRVYNEKELVPNRASGYEWAEEKWRNADYISMTWPFAAGALVSTVLDLAKWDMALGSDRLLPAHRWEQIWSPAALNDGSTSDYGFGWGVGDYAGWPNIQHGGGIPGYITFDVRYPEQKLTVIALTNVGSSNPGTIARGVATLYDPALLPPTRMAPQPDPDPERTELLKAVLHAHVSGDLPPAMTDGYRAQLERLSPDERTQLSTWITAMTEFSFIAEKDIRGRDVRSHGALADQICFYRMVAPDAALCWSFYLTAEGQVAGARLERF